MCWPLFFVECLCCFYYVYVVKFCDIFCERTGYVDLSKRRVDPEDVVKCEERYNKAKAVHSVMRHLSEVKGKQLEDMYKAVGWPLYRKYGHAYDALKMALL